MIWRLVVGPCLVLGMLIAVPATVVGEESDASEGTERSAKAIAAWDKTCQKCHAVPDTRFETDRAFLGQIMETT